MFEENENQALEDTPGTQTEPSEAGPFGRGGARERSEPWPSGRGEQSGLCDDEDGGQERVVDAQEAGTDEETAESAGEQRGQGAPREPSGAGRAGRGGARKRSEPCPTGRGEQSGLCDDEDAGQAQRQEGQSHSDNAAARAARIRAEQETAARLRKQYDDQVAGLGIPNPFTGKPFQSFEEFKAYGERYRREQLQEKAQKTGRTVEELEEEEENRSWLARKRAEEKAQKEAVKALEERNKFLSADLTAFVKAFPNVDPAKLEANPKFRKFAGKRLYQEPLGELYQDFVDLVSDTERAAVEKAAGKAHRSTGGGQGGGMDLLTPAQREALEEWNRDNPALRMTAKEFLGR